MRGCRSPLLHRRSCLPRCSETASPPPSSLSPPVALEIVPARHGKEEVGGIDKTVETLAPGRCRDGDRDGAATTTMALSAVEGGKSGGTATAAKNHLPPLRFLLLPAIVAIGATNRYGEGRGDIDVADARRSSCPTTTPARFAGKGSDARGGGLGL